MKNTANESLADLSVRDFTCLLASSEPCPGGGGVSALAGALAAALGVMTGSLTVGKKKYLSVENELKEAMNKAGGLIEELTACIDLDAGAFLPLSGIYSMPKDTPGYDELKEEALKKAAEVPMRILELSCRAVDILGTFAEKGSKLVISDAACGAALAKSSIEAAYINTLVNTRLMKDGDFAGEMEKKALGLKMIYTEKAAEIYTFVTAALTAPRAGNPADSVSRGLVAGGKTPVVMKGAPAAKAILIDLKQRVKVLRSGGVTPTLAIIRVGDDPSDLAYEKSIIGKADEIAAAVKMIDFPDGVPKETLLKAIEEINRDDLIHGCLLLRPLKDKTAELAAAKLLDPRKDVDAMTPGASEAVYAGGEAFSPCTAEAVIELIKFYGIEIAGKNAAVIGRSLVTGKPAAMLLLKDDATVTICHSATHDLKHICREADIIVAAAGKAGLLDESYFGTGQTLIDVAVNVDAAGNISGDIPEEVKSRFAGAFTPVPGGVGSVTTALLLRHLTEAAERALR